MKAVVIALNVLLILGTAGRSHALDLPMEALRLLAETTAEPCTICIGQKQDKAFRILTGSFTPGRELATDGKCLLEKTGEGNDLFLTCYPTEAFVSALKEGEVPPKLVFTFYTPQERLVGIRPEHYTDARIAGMFKKAEPGTVFSGRIKIIPYKYGTGPAYNYFKQTYKIQVHVMVLELTPLPH